MIMTDLIESKLSFSSFLPGPAVRTIFAPNAMPLEGGVMETRKGNLILFFQMMKHSNLLKPILAADDSYCSFGQSRNTLGRVF